MKAYVFTVLKKRFYSGIVSSSKHHRNNKHPVQKGFTLIELMVVFSITSLVVGVGFASLMSYSRRQEVVQASSNIQQVFKEGKFNALSFVKPTGPAGCPDTSSINSYTIAINENGQKNYTLKANCGSGQVEVLKKNLPQNISYYPTSSTCIEVTYQTLTGAIQGTPSLPCFVGVKGYGISQCFEVDTSGNTHEVSCTTPPSPTPTQLPSLTPTPTQAPTATPTPTPTPTPPLTCTDADGDGFYTVTGCGSHPTLVDCNDNNTRVNPFSTGWSTADSVVGWDYNCDGSIETSDSYKASGTVSTYVNKYIQTSASGTCSGPSSSAQGTTSYSSVSSADCGKSIYFLQTQIDGFKNELVSAPTNGTCSGSNIYQVASTTEFCK